MSNISETVQDGDSYNGLLIGTYARPIFNFVNSNDWVMLSDTKMFNDSERHAIDGDSRSHVACPFIAQTATQQWILFNFLPRDAIQARSMPSWLMRCLSVHPFVCLSRSWILSKRMNIFQFFSPSGSHPILVILYQTFLWQYCDGYSPQTGRRIIECRRDKHDSCSGRIAGNRSTTAACVNNNNCDGPPCSL